MADIYWSVKCEPRFSLGPVHRSRDLQVLNSTNITLRLGPMGIVYSLKIILLQCFHE